MRHMVKSWSMFYKDIASGIRTADIRLNDRRYAVGDILELNEFDPAKFAYTGNKMDVEITYIQTNKSNPCAISQFALHDDYVVLSVKKVKKLTVYEIYVNGEFHEAHEATTPSRVWYARLLNLQEEFGVNAVFVQAKEIDFQD